MVPTSSYFRAPVSVRCHGASTRRGSCSATPSTRRCLARPGYGHSPSADSGKPYAQSGRRSLVQSEDGRAPFRGKVHLRAISLRCHANNVSGVTGVSYSRSTARPSTLGFDGQPSALGVRELRPPRSHSFPQDPILLEQVLDDRLLPLVQPSSQCHAHQLQWSEYGNHAERLSRTGHGSNWLTSVE